MTVNKLSHVIRSDDLLRRIAYKLRVHRVILPNYAAHMHTRCVLFFCFGHI